MSKTETQNTERPLSPHLQVYRPQLTSMMSIMHRAAGFALAVGTVMVIWMLVAAATGPDAYAVFTDFTGTMVGKLMIVGWSAAFYYHLCNGIRHFFWDMGYLLELKGAYRAGYFVLLSAAALTALTWWAVTLDL